MPSIIIKMNNQASGSFIPKKTPGRSPSKVNTGRVIGVFGYFSYIVFFGTSLLALGTFGLSYYVQLSLVERQDQLLAIVNEVDDSQIQELILFDAHLRSAEEVFAGSFSVPYILTTIEESIAEPVIFYFLSATREGDQISLEGLALAESFDAALFQRQVVQDLPHATVTDIRQVELTNNAEAILRQFVSSGADNVTAQDDIQNFLNNLDGDEIVSFSLNLDYSVSDLPFSLDLYNFEAITPNTATGTTTDEGDDFFAEEQSLLDNEGAIIDDEFVELDLQVDDEQSVDLTP